MPALSAEAIAHALACGRPGCGCGKRSGKDWKTHCPACGSLSLGVSDGDDGKLLVKCWKDCSQEQVIAALRERGLWPEVNGAPRAKRTAVREAVYRVGEVGGHLVEHVRQDFDDGSKTFYWRRDGKLGLGGLKVADLPLYGLPDLLAAGGAATVVVGEGEKTRDALKARGILAVATYGADALPSVEMLKPLAGHDVVLWADADKPGHRLMDAVAARLAGMGQSSRWLDWPDAPPKGDAADYFALGGTAEGLAAMIEAAPVFEPTAASAPLAELLAEAEAPPSDDSDTDDTAPRQRRRSDATRLVEIAKTGNGELFHDASGETYATFSVGDHRQTSRINNRSFRQWLARRFYELENRAPGGQAIQDAISVLSGVAVFEGTERAVFVRVAECDDYIYLDLGDETWRVIEIAPTGWRIMSAPPIRFIRPRGLLPLASPVVGGNIDELRRFLNVASDGDYRLITGWLVAAIRGRGPYPVLGLNGGQGSAKSTAARLLRRLVDPNAADLRTPPRDERDLVIAATNAWIVALDNLSDLRPWLSDALCRLSTGGGFGTRELYSDGDERLFNAQRPVVVNGIEDAITRADLLDRAIIVRLPKINDEERRSEAEFWSCFDDAAPRILGALLDAVSAALRNLPSVRLDRLPRMADFALWATAAESSLGWAPGSFMAAYTGNLGEANALALDASPIAAPLFKLLEQGDWSGTASALLDALGSIVGGGDRAKTWPKTAIAMSNALRRITTNLLSDGVDVVFGERAGKERRRVITIQNVGAKHRSPCPPCPPSFENGNSADDTLSATDPMLSATDPMLSAKEGSFSFGADKVTEADNLIRHSSNAASATTEPRPTLPCYACGGDDWQQRPPEWGGGWVCGTCHLDPWNGSTPKADVGAGEEAIEL